MADRRLRIYDTAGLRRKAKITEKLEQLSANDTLDAIGFAQAVILVLDSDAVLTSRIYRLPAIAMRRPGAFGGDQQVGSGE